MIKASAVRNVLFGPLMSYAARLRFPRLLALTAGLFLVDLVVPDLIPFVDEILLALITIALGRWKKPVTPDMRPLNPG